MSAAAESRADAMTAIASVPAGAIVVRRMKREVLANVTVHLANEHRINPDSIPFEQRDLRHMLAHVYGEFRAGGEHYHERPRRTS